jgi:hypothetical protein
MNGQPCAYAIGFINDNDILNYVLATSKGGRVTRSDDVQGKYAQPGSRFGNAAQEEFDAALDATYVAEFEGDALGEDVTYVPGRSTVEQITQNDAFATTQPWAPEAQIFAEVASVFKDGDLGLRADGDYNDGNLRKVLISFGRKDLANGPDVGQDDVQTIGAVVEMINDMPDSTTREQALNDIFSINATDNTNGSSPSNSIQGANELSRYKESVAIVNSELYAKVLQDYAEGIKTTNLTVDLNDALTGYDFACEGSCPTPGVSPTAAATSEGATSDNDTTNSTLSPSLSSLMTLLQDLMTLIQKLL